MTAEEKKANWQRAHDLHFMRYRAGLSVVAAGEALGVGGKALRKMELNRAAISGDFMDRAGRLAAAYSRATLGLNIAKRLSA